MTSPAYIGRSSPSTPSSRLEILSLCQVYDPYTQAQHSSNKIHIMIMVLRRFFQEVKVSSLFRVIAASKKTTNLFPNEPFEICITGTIVAGPKSQVPHCRFQALIPPPIRTMLLRSAPSSTKYLKKSTSFIKLFIGQLRRLIPKTPWSQKKVTNVGKFQFWWGWFLKLSMIPMFPSALADHKEPDESDESLSNVTTSWYVATIHVTLDTGILSSTLQAAGSFRSQGGLVPLMKEFRFLAKICYKDLLMFSTKSQNAAKGTLRQIKIFPAFTKSMRCCTKALSTWEMLTSQAHRITRVPALFSSRVSEGPLIIKAFAERWNEVCKRLILTAEQFFSPNSLVTRWFFCLIKGQLWCAFIFYTHLIYACIHVYILSTCCVYIGSIPGPLTVEFLVFPLNAEIQHWYTSEFSYVYHNGPLTVESEGL